MTITELTSETFEDSSAVSAEPITDEESQDDIPTIELPLAASSVGSPSDPIEVTLVRQEELIVGETAATVVAELVTDSIRDLDVEGGYSTRVLVSATGNRAEFVSATFMKASAAVSLGICLHGNDATISSITAGSLASISPVRVGDKIFSINNKQCSKMDSASIGKYLQSLAGRVHIVAHNKGGSPNLVESMVTKSSTQLRTGLVLTTAGNRGLVVSRLHPDKVFVDSLLNIGDEVISINGINCEHLSARAASNIIKETQNITTVVARTLNNTGVVLAEVSARDSNSLGMMVASTSPAQTRAEQQLGQQRTRISSHEESSSAMRTTYGGVILCFLVGIIVVVGVVLAQSSGQEEDSYYYGDNNYNIYSNYTDTDDNNDTGDILCNTFSTIWCNEGIP